MDIWNYFKPKHLKFQKSGIYLNSSIYSIIQFHAKSNVLNYFCSPKIVAAKLGKKTFTLWLSVLSVHIYIQARRVGGPCSHQVSFNLLFLGLCLGPVFLFKNSVRKMRQSWDQGSRKVFHMLKNEKTDWEHVHSDWNIETPQETLAETTLFHCRPCCPWESEYSVQAG